MSRPDAAARAVADQMDLTDLPVDPEAVAVRMGAIVVRKPVHDGVSGMLLRRDGQTVIGLNAGFPEDRERFLLAHLVGHLHLHQKRDLLLDVADRFSRGTLTCLATDREEAEANRFAQALLAPERAVRRMAAEVDFRTGAQLVDLLAPRFGLTRTMMAVRLMGLGVILDV